MNVLRVMSLVLVMASGVMVHGKDVKDMSEAEKEVYYKNKRMVALVEACTSGQLDSRESSASYSSIEGRWPVLLYRSKPRGFFHENSAVEVRDMLRKCEDLVTEQEAVIREKIDPELEEAVIREKIDSELQKAALKWVNFKNLDDLKGKKTSAAQKIAKNRHAFLKAIDEAKGGQRIYDWSDERKISDAAKKTLHYKHPVIHRLQKLFGKKKENWA